MIENKQIEISCNLTTSKLQKRKATVLAYLKTKLIGRKELKNGYEYQFPRTDKILDEGIFND